MIKNYMSMTKLSLLFALSLLLTSQVSKAQERNPKANTGHAFLWSNATEMGFKREATEKRSRYTKHFELNDGSFKMYTSPGSIHYQTNTGWQEIDLGINANNTGTHAANPYYNGANSFKSYYPQNPMSGKIFTHVKDGDMAENIQGMYATDQNGNIVYQYQSGIPQVAVDQNAITYSNLFPNTNVSYGQQVDGRKMGVILQSAQALSGLPANAKFIVIKEKVSIPANWTVSENEGYINLFAGKTWVANILKPTAIEKHSADKVYVNDEDLMTEGTIHMTRNGNELTLYTTFSIDWLKQANRQFPVTLDPTTNFYPPVPVLPTTPTTSSVTGRLTSATSGKSIGFLRMAAAGTFSWAKFFIPNSGAASMVGASISAATLWGYDYSPTGAAADKITTVVGMQAVDPETAANSAATPLISNQINITGPIYNSNYIFGSTVPATCASTNSLCVWRSAVLTGSATSDIASQIVSQAWTAFGIKFTSGNTGTMLQTGIEITATAPANLPYLTLVYTTGGCSGVPITGTASADVAFACGSPFNLQLSSGYSTGTGITYQWQSSPTGQNVWTNIGGPLTTGPNLPWSQSSTTDYQCIVTCSGTPATSNSFTLTQGSVASCYCIPTGPASSTNYISAFTTGNGVTNISNTGTTYSASPNPGYGNYTNLVVSGNPGASINYSIGFVAGSQTVGVWVDWNQDGDFNDAGETIVATSSATATPYNNAFTIPASALIGSTRLRIRTTTSGTPQSCGFDANGETEEYTINVLGPCTTAALTNIATSSYVICPLATQVLTATAPTFQLGTSYQWKQSATQGGPYTNVVGGTGATTLTYTTPSLATGVYYYVLETTCANCGPCTVLSNEATVTAQSVASPTATNSAQCAPGVPTAFVTSTAGAAGTGNYNWYNAPTAGTLLQAKPYGPVVPYYFNDFSSIFLSNSSMTGNATITGGTLQLHGNANIQYGGFMVNASTFNSDKYTVDFDYLNSSLTPAIMGEGFSYSFSDDGVITAEASMHAENGTGSKLKLCFVAYSNGLSTQGVYLIYANNSIDEPNPTTPGVLAYSNNVTWKNASGHVKLILDSLGKATVVLNGTNLFTNVAIPAAYLTANKATWKHIWKGRTTTNTMLTSIDNVDIKQSTLITGSPTYLSPVASTTTFYVSELGTNGCLSPRTPITVTVNTPPTISITPSPNDSVCTGAPITLSGSGANTYVWNGNSTTVNGDTTFSSAVGGTFTVTGTDGNGCSNTSSILIYLYPVLSGTATATPSAFCIGGSTNLTATVTPICTGLYTSSFINYYTPSAWTFTNNLANGTLITTGSPANIKLTTGTDGSFNFGTTTLSRKITCSGTVSFNWSFIHPVEAYEDYPQYSINGGTPIDFPGYNSSLYNATQTGTISFPVVDGDSIAFHVVTLENDALAGQLTVSNFVAPSPKITGTISYWDAPTGGNNLGTPPITVTPSISGTVSYYAAYTSTATGCVNQVRQPVNLNVRPLATATMSGGGTVCTGSPMPNVSIALTGTAPWNITYVKNGVPITVTGVNANPYLVPNVVVGSYSVTNVSDAFCSGTASGSTTVALYTLPTAAISGGGLVCFGAPLPNVSIALTGTSPWSVTYTDGTTSTTVGGIMASPYVISGATAGVYSITNVTDLNCTGTQSGTATVTVNPQVSATMSGGGTVCTGSPLPNVSIALTGTAPWNVSYDYNGSTILVNGINSSPYVIANAAVGSYQTLSVSDLYCVGSVAGASNVSLYTLPTATVTGGGSVCIGNTLPDITIALTGASPWSITYTDGTMPTTVNGILTSPYVITAAPAGNYSVTNVSDLTCIGTSSGSVNVTVNPLPNVTATIMPASICSGSTATANGGGAVTYTWNNGIMDNIAFLGTATTTYIVTGTDANSCSATASATLTVNTSSTNLSLTSGGNTSSNTGTQNNSNIQPDGSTVTYSDPSCNLIATVADVAGGNALGNTTTTVTVEPAVLTYPLVGGQPYTRRWFTITPTNNTGVNANVTLYQTQDDFDDYNAANGAYPDLPTGPSDLAGIALIRITKMSGGTLGVGTASVIVPSLVNWNATTNYWEITFNVTGTFSEFYLHAANPLGSALPVSISSFNGQKTGETDLLTWATSSEQNNAYFNLQHSIDGIHYSLLEKVITKANGGNSLFILNYQATNIQPASGHNYYRLEQVDIDGRKTLNSKVIDLNRTNTSTVSIYPNPVKDVLNIDLFSNETSTTIIKISDMSGRLVKQVQTKSERGLHTITIDLNNLSSGLYTVQLLENGNSSFIERIRKD